MKNDPYEKNNTNTFLNFWVQQFCTILALRRNFDYADGALLTANGWTAHSGGGAAQ